MLLSSHAHWAELRPAAHWPGWLLIPLTIVAMDGANWLAHYADHRLGALWRFHAMHHSQEELSVLTSFRTHSLMHTTGFLLATIPVVILMPDRPIAPVLITSCMCIGTLGRPVTVEQGAPRKPALLLLTEQLAEPFQARR